MMESYGREYEAQAKHISDLRAQNIKLQHRNTDLELKYADAIFYRSLAAAIHKHETLQGEWVSFMTLLRLCEPDLESRIKEEITKYEDRLWRRF
jgi:hypothetical protein